MPISELDKQDILEYIRKKNISKLRSFVSENNIPLKELNSDSFDILIYAIEKNSSLEIIKFLINQCPYNSINYYIITEERSKIPLYSALAKNRFKIADTLIKKDADINYYNPNSLEYLLDLFSLNPKNLKYILHNGFDMNNVNSSLICQFMERKKIELLDIIFKHYIFNKDFILYLLRIYKNRISLSDKKLKRIVDREKNKIIITEEMYDKAVELENDFAMRTLFNNDNSEPDIIFCRINQYDILNKAVKTNDISFVKNVLKYEPFSFKSHDANEILINVNINNNLEIMKLLIQSAFKAIFSSNNCSEKLISNSTDKIITKTSFLNFVLNMMIRIGNLSFVEYLVEGEEYSSLIDINAKDMCGDYPMITAFYIDNLEIFIYLINHGGDSNIKNCNGTSLFSLAIDRENGYEYIKHMLQQSKPIHDECINGSDTLMKAINKNIINIVILLVKYGQTHGIDMNTIDRNGNTPLTLAYRLNCESIFKFLIKYLDINQTDINGNNILYYALLKEDEDTIKYLISNGVDINVKNKLGKSNFDLIISEGYSILCILLEYSNSILLNIPNLQGQIPLITLIRINNGYTPEEQEDVIERLIRRGSDVNFVDSIGNSPLVYAIQKKLFSVVQLLVKNDANVNFFISHRHESLLMYAIEIGELEIIKLLVDYGADINYRNPETKDSVLKKASRRKGKEKNEEEPLKIFEFLVQYDINNITGEVLNEMIAKERLDLIEILVKNNLDLNIKDENEDTPLVYAIRNRQVNIAKYLIENGADVYHKNKQGETINQLNHKYFYEYGWQRAYDSIRGLINKYK